MESRPENTIVIIPSYNEARTIGVIVRGIVDKGLSVLVIDDGSTDNTEHKALDNGAMVIRCGRNMGKGFSVREGINHVVRKTNFEWVVIMDGDGQHKVEDITLLMRASGSDTADIIVGNRMLKTEAMPFLRYWTNKFTSWVISRLCRQHIPDTQCGFRLVRVSALKKLHLTSDKYDIESEMLIQAAGSGMKIESVPIQTIYGEEASQINPIRDTIKFFSLIIRYRFKKHGLRQRT